MAQYDFFVSHANEDAEYARELVVALEARGVKCWIAPRDIPGGSDYGSEIVRAIQASRSMLLIMSAKANEAAHERKHILRELEEASNFRKPIYPLRLEPVELHDSLRYRLSVTQWIEHINDQNKLAEIIIKLLNQQLVDMPNARSRFRFKIQGTAIATLMGVAITLLITLIYAYFTAFSLNRADKQEAQNQLLGRGYEINNAGMEQAIRRSDMQSVVWFREIGVRLSTAQIHNLILDEIKKQSYSLTPIWEFMSQASALDEVAKIRKDLRNILERSDALNHLYELSCKHSANSNFWIRALNDIFSSRCRTEADWYASTISILPKLIDIANTNKKVDSFFYNPLNVSEITSATLRNSSEKERQPEIFRLKTFFSVSGNDLFFFTQDGIRIVHSGIFVPGFNAASLACRAENVNNTRLCEATVVLFVPASGTLRRSTTLPMSPNEISNRILEILRGSRVLALENVTESGAAGYRTRLGALVPCQPQPGAASLAPAGACTVNKTPPDASMSLE